MTALAQPVTTESPLRVVLAELVRLPGRTWLLLFAAAGVVFVGASALTHRFLALALESAGEDAMTTGAFFRIVREPLGALTILLAAATVLIATLLWTAFVLVIADLRLAGLPVSVSAVAHRQRLAARSFARVDVLLLGLQLAMLQPLIGLTGFSPITGKLAVPPFVIREFLKVPLSTAEWCAITAAMLYIACRFALAPAFAVVAGQRPVRTYASSWFATRKGGLALALRVGALLLAAHILQQLAITAAAPVIGLATTPRMQGTLETLSVLVLSGISLVATLGISFLFVARVRQETGATRSADPVGERVSVRATPRIVRSRMPAAAAIVLALTLSNVLAPSVAISGTQPVAKHPLVIGHRGHDQGGPENTIPGLEAAVKLGVDMVEVDMQQTKDGTFVASHDSNLIALAGKDENIGDMSTKAVTSTVIHEHGHSAHIPLMTDYVKRARELGMPLLIELKVTNDNHADPGGDMFKQLAAIHGITGNMFHSLNGTAVKRMIQLRPNVQIGLTLGLRSGELPKMKVDFYTVDQSSVTPALIAEAHAEGRRIYSWTVNDDLTMRMFLREGIDGLITDRPLRAQTFANRIDSGKSTTVDAVHDQLESTLTW